jgi:hypothetical protein
MLMEMRPKYTIEGQRIKLYMVVQGCHWEVFFDKDGLCICDLINYWFPNQLVKNFGDPTYLKERGRIPEEVNKAIEMLQAAKKLEIGMELEHLRKDEVKSVAELLGGKITGG